MSNRAQSLPRLHEGDGRTSRASSEGGYPAPLNATNLWGGRMTAQSIASVSKSQSGTVAASTVRTQGDAIIQVQDLAKIFDPDIRAVDGLALAVRRVESSGLLCPDG